MAIAHSVELPEGSDPASQREIDLPENSVPQNPISYHHISESL